MEVFDPPSTPAAAAAPTTPTNNNNSMNNQQQQQQQQQQHNYYHCARVKQYQPAHMINITVNRKNKYKFHTVAADCTGVNVAVSSDKALWLYNINDMIQTNDDDQYSTRVNHKITSTKNISSDLLVWSPNRENSHLLMSTCPTDQTLYLWDLKEGKSLMQYQKSHSRHLTSLSWNKVDSNIVCSASLDSFIKLWDIRNGKKDAMIDSIQLKSNLSQICWNPLSSTMLASSNAGEINIWDIRKFGYPLTSFTAHIGSISSIDWSLEEKNKILTCGSDKLVKVWDISPPNKNLKVYQTGSSCIKAKFVPNSKSVASISQKGYNEVCFWSGDNRSETSLSLEGHKNQLISFDFTIINNENTGQDSYHVVSIGKDEYLNVWKLNDDMFDKLNNNGNSSGSNNQLSNSNNSSSDTSELDSSGDNNVSEIIPNSPIIISSNNNNNSNNSNNNNDTPRLFVPVDLQQELGKVKLDRFKYLTLEKVSYSERICMVSVDSRVFVVIILFPSLYPSAPPSFDIVFGDSSSEITAFQVKLKKGLDKLSHELLKTKKPFLLQILQYLSDYYSQNNSAEFLRTLTRVDDTLVQKKIPKSVANQPSKRHSITPTSPNVLNMLINNSGSSGGSSNNSPTMNGNVAEWDPLTSSAYSSSSSMSTTNSGFSLQSSPSVTSTPTPPPAINIITSPLSGSTTRNRSYSASSNLNQGGEARSRSISFGGGHSIAPLPPNISSISSNQALLFEMYVVKPTDTLAGIALQYSMPRDVLVQANRLHSDKLMPGTILWVYKKKNILDQLTSPSLQPLDGSSSVGSVNMSSSFNPSSLSNLTNTTPSSSLTDFATLSISESNDNLSNIDSSMGSLPLSPTSSWIPPTSPTPYGSLNPSFIENIQTMNQIKANSLLQQMRAKVKTTSPTVNINSLFKPLKEEVEMAFQKSQDGAAHAHMSASLSSANLTGAPTTTTTATNSYTASWNSLNTNRKFTQIPKESIVKENLVCFTKDKKVYGTLTLTPYQMFFQSIHSSTNSKPTVLFADYSQIVSCKYFPNKTEWIAHLSKDWNKEIKYVDQKNSKVSKEDQDRYNKFIQSEISKLNEMEDESTTIKDFDPTYNDQDKKVLVFPCIYVLLQMDKFIQTLFFRGFQVDSVHHCFSYLKKLIVDSKLASPPTTSPAMTGANSAGNSIGIIPTYQPSSLDVVKEDSSNDIAQVSTSIPIQIPRSIGLGNSSLFGDSIVLGDDYKRTSDSSSSAKPTATSTQPINTSTTSNMFRIPSYNNIKSLSASSGSFDEYVHSPKLLKDQIRYHHQQEIIMNPEIFKKLRHYLPIRTQGSDIELVYNSTNDGVSFTTFYRRMSQVDQSILLIKDNKGYIFGAFLSEQVKPKKDVFYGNGETFLFKLYPEFAVYKWTKENDLFIYSSHDYISIGGGSMFGLWMNNDFLNGYSGPCETFNNSTLSFENDFRPIIVECWGIK
ncbi:hypothetical protein CYY_009807 [Polysphondylium violaceum]|uniref:WD40 repeat-containing protein n=1 Tax=Polysphondylium violaceum TaxID=133409 RepID=A0A8J4PL57_9MYCE|nr:hypothetical protein CYY_009807 [Polysphondylium violaceum]